MKPLSIIVSLPVLFIAISGCFLQSPAEAAPPQCDQRDSVLQLLEQNHKETPVSLGVTGNGALIEVFSTQSGSTWTIVVTSPQGISCLVAAGENWRSMDQPIHGIDS